MERNQQVLTHGDQIENYTIERLLGAGGFGMTYKAYDRSLDCTVAIKEYFPSQISIRNSSNNHITPKSNQFINTYKYGLLRFLDEARVLAQFKNNNIVRVSRFLESNNTAYIIMDYEEGVSLHRFLKCVQKLTEKELRLVATPVMKGIKAIHKGNYLHRDIKPANIYLRKNGSPVLLDFGSARQAITDVSKSMTCVVSVGYSPFEQYNRHEKQGPWTDIYGLGATLYQCISGHKPIDALDRVAAIHNGKPDPLLPAIKAGNGVYSVEILTSIDRMLNIHIKDRPSTIDEILPGFAGNMDDSSMGIEAFEMDSGSVLSSNNSHEWDMELVRSIETRLMKYMGPLASVLVKKAMPLCRNIDELFEILSTTIDEPEEREKFYSDINQKTSISLSGTHRSSRTSQGGSSSNPDQQVNDAFISAAEQQLAYHIGPLARTFVRNALKETRNTDDLLQILACEIPTEEERNSFINGLKLQH